MAEENRIKFGEIPDKTLLDVACTMLAMRIAQDGIDANWRRKLKNFAAESKIPPIFVERVAGRVLPQAIAIIAGATDVRIEWGVERTSQFSSSEPLVVPLPAD